MPQLVQMEAVPKAAEVPATGKMCTIDGANVLVVSTERVPTGCGAGDYLELVYGISTGTSVVLTLDVSKLTIARCASLFVIMACGTVAVINSTAAVGSILRNAIGCSRLASRTARDHVVWYDEDHAEKELPANDRVAELYGVAVGGTVVVAPAL